MTKTIEYTNKEAQEFWSTLRKRVNAYFKENEIKKTANCKGWSYGFTAVGPFCCIYGMGGASLGLPNFMGDNGLGYGRCWYECNARCQSRICF